MDTAIQDTVELFTHNTHQLDNEFVWDDFRARRIAVLHFAFEGRTVDLPAVRECRELLKSETGVFSALRGRMQVCFDARDSSDARSRRKGC